MAKSADQIYDELTEQEALLVTELSQVRRLKVALRRSPRASSAPRKPRRAHPAAKYLEAARAQREQSS